MMQTFDSVWDAIEDTPQQAENMKVRAQLLDLLKAHIEKMQLTQVEAAKVFGVTQPRISDLMRGKITVFSIDMLINMMACAEIHISRIEITQNVAHESSAAARQKHGAW